MDVAQLQFLAQQLRKPDGDAGRQIGEQMNAGNYLMNKNTLEHLQAPTGARILEIGMGNGHFVKDILATDPTIRYTGCDYAETMVAEAQARNAAFQQSGQADFMLASASELPFDNDTFDRIFAVNTIYFWEDPAKELAEIRRVLKPDGKLLIAARPSWVMEQMPFTDYGFTRYSKEQLADVLHNNSFSVIELEETREPEYTVNGIVTQMGHMIAIAIKNQ
ncbi:MAG: class I SAM-dependent methyltransferase [Sphingobacteriales bacterium]|nr:MAG: class I SAM-dependent methyltransferase [Sphingobacteriales bacterium]